MGRLVFSATAIFVLVVVLSGTTVWAASTSLATRVSNFVINSLFGGYARVTNNLFAVDQGFTRATQSIAPSGADPSSRVPFSSSPGLATNGINPGDWVVTFAVNTTATTVANSNFTITLSFSMGTTSVFSLYLKTGSTVSSSPPYEILCMFDIGPTLGSPYSYTFGIIQTN